MDIAPNHSDSLVAYESNLDLKAYKKCTELLEKRRHEESFHEFIRYVNAELAKKTMVEKNHWVIPHGSLILDVKITPSGILEIRAPFLKLPPERRIALLRQICEFNFNVLILSQVLLDGDDLTFHFSTPLTLIDPHKIYGALQEICLNGDSYDDAFIEKFGAVPLREKTVEYLPEKTVGQAWESWHLYLDEALTYDQYFQDKRWRGFSYDILAIALMKIDFVIAPQGFLRTEVEKSIMTLFSRRHPDEIVLDVREDVKKLKTYPKDKFARDLYKPSFFIPARTRSDVSTCQNNLQQRYEWTLQDRSAGSNVGVVLNYLFGAYRLLYNYFLPEKLQEEVLGVLRATSQKPWNEAADLMVASFQKIMDPAYAK
jgi:hypothetical protein